MKLIRLENSKSHLGFFNCGFHQRYRTRCNDTELSELYWEMCKELHAPRHDEYSFIKKPSDLPEKALFYFKESFIEKYQRLFDDIIITLSISDEYFSVITINLDNVQEYTMYYQDKDQCLIYLEERRGASHATKRVE